MIALLKKLPAWLDLLRPGQWIKNVLVGAGLFFALADQSQTISLFETCLRTAGAVVIFCLLSGAIYILNDLHDMEADRLHPEKSKRALASGRISKHFALVESAVLIVVCSAASFFIGIRFAYCAIFYLGLQLLYTFYFKNVALVDVIFIAMGFSLRVYAGIAAARVNTSAWIFTCTFGAALLLALCKRRSELIQLGDRAAEHRKTLGEYTVPFLDVLISSATTFAILCYALWTLSPTTIAKFHAQRLAGTVPFVLYGFYRYLYLVYVKGQGGRPEKLFIHDRPLIWNMLLFVLAYLAIWLTA